jgi:hypothetical protein
MIKLVMQCMATFIEEILDVIQQLIFFFTPLLANKTKICNHIVPQILILIYTISCFVFIFLCWQSCPYITDGMFITVLENSQ